MKRIIIIVVLLFFFLTKSAQTLQLRNHGDKILHFRQSRNGDKDYTEHFYHQNNIKDTHINCENDTYQSVKKELSEFDV